MIDRTFDPSTMIAAAREAFAPVLKAQQEGFKMIERLARERGVRLDQPHRAAQQAHRAHH